MDNLIKTDEILKCLDEAGDFKKDVLELWALSIFQKCADQIKDDDKPNYAKHKIMELFKEI